jgi:hypothetical protein
MSLTSHRTKKRILVGAAAVVALMLAGIAWQLSMAGSTTLKCSETLYDKSGNNPFDVPAYFIVEHKSLFRNAKLLWENFNPLEHVDFSVITDSDLTIEAIGKSIAYMPLPAQIDSCIEDEIRNPEMRDTNGAVNTFAVLACVTKADTSSREVPINLRLTINRLTGEMTIRRSQDENTHHDTENYGKCAVSKPVL